METRITRLPGIRYLALRQGIVAAAARANWVRQAKGG
jgi:hypothetical protein